MFPNFIPSPYFSPSLKQRVLIRPSEISNLYNSGTGIQHPFTLTVGTTSAPLVYSENQAASDTNLPVTIDYGTLPTQASTTAYLPAVVYPYATTTSTSTINTLTVATTTSYTVYSPFSNYQDDSRGTVTTYLTLNGTLIGTYTYQKGNEASTGKLTFIHTNYLGTPVFETDDKGDIVEMDITDVFGNYVMRDQRKDSPYHAKAYTGHEYDDVTGLTYAHARYLDTKAHTFLSVDPLLYSLPQSYLTDPQEMNSYAYARNNPIVYTDPTGLASYINYGQGYLPPTTVYITPYTRFTGNNSPTYLSIRNPRPQPTITKSNIDDLLLSGYGSMARDDWQAGNYGYAALFVGMAASSAVSSVYTAPEKAILREGVIATELLKGKKVTATTHGALRRELAKQIDLPKGIEMHHIVEQNADNIAKFGTDMIHSSDNVVFLNKSDHTLINTNYTATNIITGQSLRNSIKGYSFQEHFNIGSDILRNVLNNYDK